MEGVHSVRVQQEAEFLSEGHAIRCTEVRLAKTLKPGVRLKRSLTAIGAKRDFAETPQPAFTQRCVCMGVD